MSSFLLKLSTSDLLEVLPRWTDKCFIQFILFADVQLSFNARVFKNELQVTFHFM